MGSPGLNPPIGIAFTDAGTDDGLELWRLVIGKGEDRAELPGRFVIVDGEFIPRRPPGAT